MINTGREKFVTKKSGKAGKSGKSRMSGKAREGQKGCRGSLKIFGFINC
jgi:hypothetical protein